MSIDDEMWRDYPGVEVLKRVHGADRGFSAASFPTTEVGFVTDLTRRLFKTEDGGRNWRWLPSICSEDVAFATPLVGYAHGPDTLYRTEDGGHSWRRVLTVLPAEIREVLRAPLLPFPGVEDVEALIEPLLAWCRQTHGQGKTPVPGIVANIYHRIVPISETTAWAHNQDYILVTEDGGHHWRVLGESWNRDLSAVARVDDALWYAGTGLGKVYRTTDSGRTWSHRGTRDAVAALIAFPSADVGYATGPISHPHAPYGYGLFKTRDGGVSWRRLSTEVPGRATQLVFVSEESGFVAGQRGILMCTIDGGETWALASLAVKPSFERLLFPTPDVGYAVGSRSTIMNTIDGGNTWTVLTHGAERFEKALQR
jgi:photosystem II stability/assembly factor-like uncharacterized protein